MREYSKVFPKIWIGQTAKQIKKFGIETQLLAHYLITSPHATMIGIYYLPIAFIVHETGIPYEAALNGLDNLTKADFCSYDPCEEYVWVHGMAQYQISDQLKPNDNRVKYINQQYQGLPKLPFQQRFFEKYKDIFFLSPFEGSCKPLSSQKQEQEQEQEQEQKEKKTALCSHNASSPKKIVSQTERHDDPLRIEAIGILDFLSEKAERKFENEEHSINLIKARLKSGSTRKNCFQIIAKKTREWKKDEKMNAFLRPSTIFSKNNFSKYLMELSSPVEGIAYDR